MDVGRRALSGLKWSAGARLAGQLLTWAVTLVVIRLLSPDDYGLMGMTIVFVAFLGIFSDLGLGLSVVQERELDEQLLRRIYGMVLVSHVMVFALLFTAAPLIATFFRDRELIPLVQVMSTQFALTAVCWIPGAMLRREMRFRALATIDFVSLATSALVTLLLALDGGGVWALALGSLAKSFARIVLINLVSRVRFRPSFNFRGLSKALAFGGYSTLLGVLWQLFSQVDRLIVGKIAGKEALGVYTVAMELATLPLSKALSVVQPVAFPAFARLQHDLPRVANAVLRALRAMMLLAFPMFFGLSAVAPELVHIVLGAKWQAACFPLQVLPLVMPIRMASGLISPAVTGVGRADIAVRNMAWALAAMATGFTVGSLWGVNGVAVAWLVAYPLVMTFNFKRSLAVLTLTRTDVLRAMAKPFVAALLMYLMVAAGREALPAQWPEALRLAMLIGVGAITYLVATMTFNRDELRALMRLARG
jgi:O-antigen/teichoic acid export membrane protein